MLVVLVVEKASKQSYCSKNRRLALKQTTWSPLKKKKKKKRARAKTNIGHTKWGPGGVYYEGSIVRIEDWNLDFDPDKWKAASAQRSFHNDFRSPFFFPVENGRYSSRVLRMPHRVTWCMKTSCPSLAGVKAMQSGKA